MTPPASCYAMTKRIHQKTTLADGFSASVGLKLTVSPVKVNKLYHKLLSLSNQFKCLRGPDGIRTRTFYWRGKQSTINLLAQLTEARILSHKIWFLNKIATALYQTVHGLRNDVFTQAGFIKLSKRGLATTLILSTLFVGTGLIYLFNPFTTKTAEAVWRII